MREEILTGKSVSEVFRDYAGIYMRSGRILCLVPDTSYGGMPRSALQKQIIEEYFNNSEEIKKGKGENIRKICTARKQ